VTVGVDAFLQAVGAGEAELLDDRPPDPELLTVKPLELGDLAAAYGVTVDPEQSKLTLADYFDVHLDHAPKEGASLGLDSIVLVARSIGGGRVNVVGLRLPEDDEESESLTRVERLKRKLAEIWSSVAGW
jgi:cell volume regulation protein A